MSYLLAWSVLSLSQRDTGRRTFLKEHDVKQLHKFALGAVSACVVALSPLASQAATIQLGFILDRSGSIPAADWNVIVDGLSSAIGTLIPVGGADTYEISVVSFATSASADVSNFLVSNAAQRTALATTIFNLGDGRSGDVYVGGSTNFQAAFTTMNTVLSNTIAGSAFSYVNFATDGVPNASAVAERNALINAGVDNISIEGIGNGVNAASLQNDYCYPQPCDTTSPYNFPTQGFYIAVNTAADYAAAIANKIRTVTGQVPEPGTLALAGLALAGIGATMRRKSA